MQELVSFISIMLGTVVLTAWVMWILFRPSGDNKVEEFATRSARDGLTEAVMENNELKNKVTRLERELNVLMSAGYQGKSEGQGQEERGKGKGERLEAKDEGLETKDEEKGKGERGKGKGKTKDSGLRTKDENEGLKAEDEEVQSRSVARRDGLKDEVKEEGSKAKDKGLKTKDEGLKAEDEEVQSRSVARRDGLKGEVKEEGLKTKGERESVEEESRKAQENLLKIKELESQIQENEARVKAKAEATPSPEVAPLSEVPRATDETEKKKIADYLASVAETTERQMKEVKALDEVESQHPDDDLKKIKGIGPHLEGRLKKAGISSYQQIADFKEDEIRHVSEIIGSFPRRIRREGWVEQAKKLIGKG